MVFKKGNIPWNLGIPATEETKKKISESGKGRIVSEETRLKISKIHKGKFVSEESKRKNSEAHKGINNPNYGKHHSEETRLRIGRGNKGKKQTEEAKLKMSRFHKGRPNPSKGKPRPEISGINNYGWKGGITSLVEQIRKCLKYRQWVSDVYTIDDFTCQECGQRGGDLNAHHIKSFSSILQKYEITTYEQALECDELWNINNGITLCRECHRKLHKKSKKILRKENLLWNGQLK